MITNICSLMKKKSCLERWSKDCMCSKDPGQTAWMGFDLLLNLYTFWVKFAKNKFLIFSFSSIFFFFFLTEKIELDIKCKLFPNKTICMKCQVLFPRQNELRKMFENVVLLLFKSSRLKVS